ncbi:MAG: glycosyltransferase family 2 protein, partial [Nitrospirae bacterium]|nr:glycosyltransferase family 2 protein [Nitrospirota bacterium]
MNISIIIPTLNEAAHIGRTLQGLKGSGFHEIIVADGGSLDETVRAALEAGAEVVRAPRGRALQMNAGAKKASGDILLFLHADTRLPPGAAAAIREALSDPGTAGGAFALAIDSPRPSLRWIARAANLRPRLTRIPYGDQGIFVRREIFER